MIIMIPRNYFISEISPDDLTAIISAAVRHEIKELIPRLPPKIQEAEELLTLKQGAEFLQISSVTLSKLIKEGAIPCYRISATIRLKKSDILKSLVAIRSKKYSKGLGNDPP
jgi:excisionase family DNA binding protein